MRVPAPLKLPGTPLETRRNPSILAGLVGQGTASHIAAYSLVYGKSMAIRDETHTHYVMITMG